MSAALAPVVVMVRATSTGVLLAGTLAGAKEQFASTGKPEQAKVVAVAVDGFGVSVKCSVADWPAVTVTDGSVGLNVKLSVPGLTTVTMAVACAAAPFVSVTVSVTFVLPCGYGPGGVCVMVNGSPSASDEPLLMLAFALPPSVADATVTFWAIATGT